MKTHELKEETRKVSWHVLRNKSNIGYIGINPYGWARGKQIGGVLENLFVNHNPHSKPEVPHRLFMIFEAQGEYKVGDVLSSVEIMGLSKNGYPSILIEDTYED